MVMSMNSKPNYNYFGGGAPIGISRQSYGRSNMLSFLESKWKPRSRVVMCAKSNPYDEEDNYHDSITRNISKLEIYLKKQTGKEAQVEKLRKMRDKSIFLA